jgi:hypothetical protein
VRLFDRIARKLDRRFGDEGVSAVLPYTRATFGLMLRDGFDADTARQYRELLREAPNLAAAVMHNTLGQWLLQEEERMPQGGADAPASRKRALEQDDMRKVRARTAPDAAQTPSPRGTKRLREEEEHERRMRPRIASAGAPARREPERRPPEGAHMAPARPGQ